LTGLAVAHESNKYIAIAGIAEMAASSLSMAAGVYLSSQAENDLYRGAIADELAEMEIIPRSSVSSCSTYSRRKGYRRMTLTRSARSWLATPARTCA